MNKIKITNIYTPEAVKTTDDFKIELYKDFTSVPDYNLDNLILTVAGPIAAD